MEIPSEYKLTLEEVELNQNPDTKEWIPFIGRKYGRIYTPEVTGVSCYMDPDNILRDLIQDELKLLIGPIIDKGYFHRTGELRELELADDTVLFWDSYHQHLFEEEPKNG